MTLSDYLKDNPVVSTVLFTDRASVEIVLSAKDIPDETFKEIMEYSGGSLKIKSPEFIDYMGYLSGL